ncbi:MAG: Ig-like domain-containing protein [Clostridia bacterium]|nr:Ig-like domain-containing protein [Clostridia bacterium]
MKKKMLALFMCVLMVMGAVPLVPEYDYFGIQARAYNIENLEAALDNVPPQEEWDNYLSTESLKAYYDVAMLILRNPGGFDQESIDDAAQKLQSAIDSLEYHTLGVSLNKSTHSAAVGSSFELRATLAPDGKGKDPVEWTSENPDAVSVSSTGVVTVKKYSAEPVRVVAVSNGFSAGCLVTILNPLGGVMLSHDEAEIFEGDRFTVIATPYGVDSGAGPTDELTYSWKSNNTSVATVNQNGVITGVKAGTCTVTVTVSSGATVYTDSCSITVKQTVPVTSLTPADSSLSKNVNLTVNEKYEYSLRVSPSDASNKTITWTAEDPSVVSISDIKVTGAGIASAKLTALKSGTTKVTYSTTDGTNISGEFTVTVKPLISSLAFTSSIKVLTPETSGERFTTVIMPENAGNQLLSWSTSDKNVCEVDYNGVLYPRGLGTCTITATTQDGTAITVKGTVRVTRMASAVTVNKETLDLKVPATYKLSATVVAIDNTSYGDVLWTSSDPKVATVDENGLVTARYPGRTVIKATALDGTEKFDACIVTVTQPVEGLELPATKAVYVGKSFTLTPEFIPSYASNKNVTWKTSNNSVATVDENGLVTGKSVGKATITCTAEDGAFVAECVVTVLIATTGVTLNYTEAKIWKDQTVTLVPTIKPADATNKNVSWTSSDNSVATVDENGVVRGVAGGTCVITCTTANSSKTATCTVTVLESATGVSFASDEISLYLGQTYYNKASVIPSTATNQNVSWATNNDLVVRVSQSGELTAVGEGTAIVTVKTEDGGFIATCSVTVYSKVPVTGLTLDTSSLSLDVGEYYTFLATVYPSNASDKGITWRTDNSSVVAVAQTGLIKAKAAGTAIITATTDDGNFTQKCKVTVTQPVTGIRLNTASVTIARGNQKSLIANVLPTNATNREVIWDSSDETVARVSSTGVVTAVSAGNCTITATTVDGDFTAICDFTVYIPVTGITMGADEIKIPRGETRLLTATVYPADASNRTVTWHSSNTSVATVNEVGQVTGRTRGTAIIYATTNDGAFIGECVVQVVQLATSVTLNYASITIDAGAYKQFTATLTPATVSDTTVKWSTSNKEVVVVSKNGLIKGVGPGVATITCRSGDGAVSTTCRITVTQPVTGITLDPKAMAVRENGMRAITATVIPSNATDSKLSWISSNPTIASVDADGIVYGHKPGTVTITAISDDNSEITAKCTVKVIRSVTGMTLNKASVTMNVGASTTVTPIFYPADATMQTAKWTSSNYDVADVDENGKITAKAPGYAVITATSSDGGFKASCDVLSIRPVSGVKLSKTSVSLEVDEKYQASATVLPSDASDKTLKWSSSDKTVATVSSSGVITGKSQGTATITCKTVDGGFKATMKVTVLKKVTGISLNYSSKVLYLDKTLQLKATVTPTDATDKGVYWYSGNKNIATVDQNGLVKPVSPGNVTIGVRTDDGAFKAYCKLEIRKAVEKISLNTKSVTVYVDEYYQLKATVLPDDATVKTVKWTVSDSTVLTLSSKGFIKGKNAGTATVTATSENGLKATCKVTVLQSVEGIELNTDAITLYTGEKETLTATVLPLGAYNQGVKWTSSNVSVARVTNGGEISALKAGSAVITATTAEGGFTATCTVTVKQHVTSISFDRSTLDIRKGSEADLTVSVLPADATNRNYKIVSSDPATVFVTEDGHLVALRGGTATITVTAEDNGKTGICKVTVLEPVTGVKLEKNEDTVLVGDEFTIKAIIEPEDANNQNVIWSTSDSSIASVSASGVITVLKEGEVTVTVTTVDNGFMDSCVLTCLQPPETLVTDKQTEIIRGKSGKLEVTVLPENSYDKTVTFESDDESIVKIDSEGNFIAVAPGTATVTVRAQMGKAQTTCIITVIEPVTGVEIKESELTVYKGTDYSFNAAVYPANASNQKVSWKVSNEAVARIDSEGRLIALDKGQTYVTVTTADGRFIDFCRVEVVLPVEDIAVTEEYTLNEGEQVKAQAAVLPSDAYNTALRFESENEEIAKVDSEGIITAVSKGETYINVISVDNPQITKQIKVNVIRLVEEIELSFSEQFLNVGQKGDIGVVLNPAEPTDSAVSFTSSDEDIATVDENGKVTANKAGFVTVTVASADGNAEAEIEIEIRQQVMGIEITETEKTVNVDDVFTLTATVLPEDSYNKEVEWFTSDEEVISVNGNEFTALKTGEATLTAVSEENGEIKAECKVTVIRMADSVEADFDREYLWVGESGKVTATVLPEDTTDKSVSFTSSDEEIATVDESGTVTAHKAGNVTITVKNISGVADLVEIEIRQQATDIQLDESEKTVNVDDVFTLTATVLPEDSYNKEVEWFTSDEEVISVNGNEFAALKTGEATLTAVSEENGEIKAECKVTVIRMADSVEAEFDKEFLWVGESGKVTATVLPEDTTDKSVSFTSSDEEIATVDESGTVTAHKAGNVTITVTAVGERVSADIEVEVRQKVTELKLDESEKTVRVDDVFTLTATALPEDSYNKEVEWFSSDEEVISVNGNEFTALKTGEATLTAVSEENGEIKAECKVTVIRLAESIRVTFDKEYLWVGESGDITVTVLPEDTTDKSAVYKVSDERILTVDKNGKVTAKSAGKAYVTVKSINCNAIDFVGIEVRQQVTGLEISLSEKTLNVGEEFTLTASVLPENAYNKNIEWLTSDEEIISVADGKVTALKTGEATVTAVSKENGEIKAACNVTVERYVEGVKLSEETFIIEKGNSYQLVATVLPEDATDKSLTWVSSDSETVSVDENGKITALKAGEATITANTAFEGISAQCKVTVKVSSAEVLLNKQSAELYCGETLELTATVLPEDTTDKGIIWSSSDEEIATVDENGVVTAHEKGEATITVKTKDNGKAAECVITVLKHVSDVKISTNSFDGFTGRPFTLTAQVSPADASNKNLIWNTSDSAVATVENGVVTPLRKGTAIISVKSEDNGLVDYCYINIGIGIDAISLSHSEISLHKGESFTLSAHISPENATTDKLIWTSEDNDIITVSDGVITAGRKSGTVKVRVTAADNDEAYAECTVTVIEQVTGIDLNETDIQLMSGDSFTLIPVITPDNATYPEVEWKSNDDTVASVDANGVVTAVNPGTAYITCTNEDSGIAAICKVFVPRPVESFTVSLPSLNLSKGASSELVIESEPADHDEDFTFVSSDSTVLTVERETGIVRGVAAGTATVTAVSTLTGKRATVDILVIQPVEDIRFDLAEYKGAYTGQQHKLSYAIYPADAYNKAVEWSSSDESIATVDSEGNITYHKKGEVIIRVTSKEKGLYAECKVTVSQSPETIYISAGAKTMAVGNTEKLTIAITPVDAPNQTVFWSTSSEAVVTVDSEGNITAIAPGKAIITVTTWNGKTATCTVTVE